MTLAPAVLPPVNSKKPANPSREVPDGPRTSDTRPSEPRSAAISGADGVQGTRSRGISGGTPRRDRARTQWPQAFPAGMKSRDPTP